MMISKFKYKDGILAVTGQHEGMILEKHMYAPMLNPDPYTNDKLYLNVINSIADLQYALQAEVDGLEVRKAYTKYAELRFPTITPFLRHTCTDVEKTQIENVIFNDPATIVFWKDGTKTVVKAQNEPFDKEKGLAMAFIKKHLGNKGKYFNTIKKFTKEKNNENNA